MIELSVDGSPIEFQRLEMHFQNEPRPGGSMYVLEIDDEDIVAYVKTLCEPGVYSPVPDKVARRLLGGIRSLVSFIYSREAPLFWANTVDYLSVSESSVVLRGVCSQHVQGRE